MSAAASSQNPQPPPRFPTYAHFRLRGLLKFHNFMGEDFKGFSDGVHHARTDPSMLRATTEKQREAANAFATSKTWASIKSELESHPQLLEEGHKVVMMGGGSPNHGMDDSDYEYELPAYLIQSSLAADIAELFWDHTHMLGRARRAKVLLQEPKYTPQDHDLYHDVRIRAYTKGVEAEIDHQTFFIAMSLDPPAFPKDLVARNVLGFLVTDFAGAQEPDADVKEKYERRPLVLTGNHDPDVDEALYRAQLWIRKTVLRKE